MLSGGIAPRLRSVSLTRVNIDYRLFVPRASWDIPVSGLIPDDVPVMGSNIEDLLFKYTSVYTDWLDDAWKYFSLQSVSTPLLYRL